MRRTLTRRHFLATTAASTALIAAPYVRGAHAAGKLTIGFWDHWVPGANDTLTALCQEWAANEKVELQIDYIPSQGNKLLLTQQAEAQAGVGHDIIAISTWQPGQFDNRLERVDDVMEPILKANGPANPTAEYLGKSEGHWIAVPATVGRQLKAPCPRLGLMKQ